MTIAVDLGRKATKQTNKNIFGTLFAEITQVRIMRKAFFPPTGYQSDMTIFFDFSLTVKAAPHECVIRTGQP